ncbi:MAG TPA: hypothetical protein VF625_06780 [Longimicrobium sp.]
MAEPFQAFAESCNLACSAEIIGIAPRDVLAPLHAVEQHYLVSLTRTGARASEQALHIVFARPLSESERPSTRDVLWWLAGDAFAVEQATGELIPWALSYGYPPDAPETTRLFELQSKQATQLRALVGDVGYHRLLALYESELTAAPR